MNIVVKRVSQFVLMPLSFLFLQVSAFAQPTFIPGLMGVEVAYIDRPASGADTATAVLTITNLHPSDPIVILEVSGGMFEEAVLLDASGNPLEQVVIQRGERLEMSANGVHIGLNGVDASMLNDEGLELTLFMRRGLEPAEPVEAREAEAFGPPAREAGIPNEKEYVINIDVR